MSKQSSIDINNNNNYNVNNNNNVNNSTQQTTPPPPQAPSSAQVKMSMAIHQELNEYRAKSLLCKEKLNQQKQLIQSLLNKINESGRPIPTSGGIFIPSTPSMSRRTTTTTTTTTTGGDDAHFNSETTNNSTTSSSCTSNSSSFQAIAGQAASNLRLTNSENPNSHVLLDFAFIDLILIEILNYLDFCFLDSRDVPVSEVSDSNRLVQDNAEKTRIAREKMRLEQTRVHVLSQNLRTNRTSAVRDAHTKASPQTNNRADDNDDNNYYN